MTQVKSLLLVGISIVFFVGCSGSGGGSPTLAPKVHKENNDFYGDSCNSMVLPSTGDHLYYCIKDFFSADTPQNYLYYFHGLGGAAGDIFPFMTEFQDIRSKFNRNQLPVHISLSLGPNESIPLEVSGENPATLRDIMDYAIPKIEKELTFYSRPGTTPFVPARHLVGLSLGGYNALNVAALRPGFFKSVMALCPALIDFNPFDPIEIDPYIDRTGARDIYVNNMISLIQGKFGGFLQWNARNPIQLMSEGKYSGTALFVSTGSEDEYGFEEGAAAFYNASKDWDSANSIYAPTKGPHCSFDRAKLLEFLKINLR